MDRSYNIHETKTNLSRMLNDVCHGETFIIAKAGKPIARLVPIEPVKQKRQLGALAGKAVVPKDIKKPFEAEINAMFYGGDWAKNFPVTKAKVPAKSKRSAAKGAGK
jgi:prevent-host-death family protein